MIIERKITKEVEKHLFQGKVIIIYGPRQSGKTTLAKQLLSKHNGKYLSCDDIEVSRNLSPKNVKSLKEIIGNQKLIVIDEAQRVHNIGLTLKLLVDNYPDTQIIATGSSSFELANEVNEPLTGRNYKFYLFPFSLDEVSDKFENYERKSRLYNFMTYGMYPDVLLTEDLERKEEKLKLITNDYLFRDLFSLGNIRNPILLQNLAVLLATRMGKEISYLDLAKTLNTTRETVLTYIRLLEQSFIIFRLTPYYTNKNKEVSSQHKIYFYDIGIRNILMNNVNLPDDRSDKGEVFENFFIAEMQKKKMNTNSLVPLHFWKGKYGSEIDLVDAKNGYSEFDAYECKFATRRVVLPDTFNNLYPKNNFKIVTIENIFDILT